MEDLRHPGRVSRGTAFACRRWQLGLVVLGTVLCIAMTDGDLKTGAGAHDGPSASIAQDDHEAPIWSLTFAGRTRLASSTITGEVRLKDLATGRNLRWLRGPRGPALSLAFSRDGRTLAFGGNGPDVWLLDAETGVEQEPLVAGTRGVRSIAFSPDGTMLAVGSSRIRGRHPIVMFWEWPDRHRLADLDGDRGSINAMTFSPDGSRLVMGDAAGDVRLWDVGTWEERLCRRAHGGGITALAFSPDSRLFATASYADGDVRLWEATSGEPRGSLPKFSTGVAALAFSPDGTTLAVARGDGIASLSDITTGRDVGAVRVPTGSLQAVAFSGDGRLLATGGSDGSVRLWDVTEVLSRDPRDNPTRIGARIQEGDAAWADERLCVTSMRPTMQRLTDGRDGRVEEWRGG
jgi:WD40 repeat protein